MWDSSPPLSYDDQGFWIRPQEVVELSHFLTKISIKKLTRKCQKQNINSINEEKLPEMISSSDYRNKYLYALVLLAQVLLVGSLIFVVRTESFVNTPPFTKRKHHFYKPSTTSSSAATSAADTRTSTTNQVSSIIALSSSSSPYTENPHTYNEYSKFKYNRNSNLRKQFQRDRILYKKSILSPSEFQIIQNEVSNIPKKYLQNEKSNTVARDRIGMSLAADCEIVRVLSCEDGSLHKIINDIATGTRANESDNDKSKRRMVLSKVVPVELRIYEKLGSGMEWHVDDALYNPEQIEIVFTIENNSDCVTKWEDLNNKQQDHQHRAVEVETEANSAIIIKAGPSGVPHFVSALKTGRRSILKLVFIEEGSTFLDDAKDHINQFSSSKKKNKKNK